MAVYTKINQSDIDIINNKFNIEKILSFQGITKGIENTNYILKSKNKKFILTIFEKRVLPKEIPFFMKLMDHLNDSNINLLINQFPKYKIVEIPVSYKPRTKEEGKKINFFDAIKAMVTIIKYRFLNK